MYSFAPIASEICHNGWFVLALLVSVVLLLIILSADEDVLSGGGKLAALLIFGIFLNYTADWTSYEKTYANEKVVAEFVQFQPEGYNEKSGKTRADHHYVYVVYKLPNNSLVLLQGNQSVTYPQRAICTKLIVTLLSFVELG